VATFCTRCGKQISPGEICGCSTQNSQKVNLDTSSLKAFYIAIKNKLGIGEPETNLTDCYERGQQIVPENIKANEGEIPVKQYDVAILRSRRKLVSAEGRMQVTNKRVLFRATGRSTMGRTTFQHEFAIQEIAGLEIRKDYRFSILDLIFGLILAGLCAYIFMTLNNRLFATKAVFIGVIIALAFGIAGQIPFFALKKKFFRKMLSCAVSVGNLYVLQLFVRSTAMIKDSGLLSFLDAILMICLVLAVIIFIIAMFLFCFKPNLAIDFKTKGGHAPVQIRSSTMGMISMFFPSSGGEFTGFYEVLPGKDAEIAIREVGAMISDIQTLGDFGLEKWMGK
jgi:hypothetical protein